MDINKDEKIVKSEFFAKTMDSGFSEFTREEMNTIFRFIDSNKNEIITLKEFK